MMKFDEILVHIGEFGTYQKRLYLLLCLATVSCGITAIVTVFIVGEPAHRCVIPGYENDTYSIQDDYHRHLVNLTIPQREKHGHWGDNPCEVFMYNGSIIDFTNTSEMGKVEREREQCEKWVYDKSVYKATAVTQMDMVCDRSTIRSHVKMAFMAGKFFGLLVLNVISDMIGRKKVFCLSIMLTPISGVIAVWMPEVFSLAACIFLMGVSNAGTYTGAFIIGVEFTGPSKRFISGTVLDFFFAFGECLTAGVAYFTQDWQLTVLILFSPCFLFIGYIWLIPESTRWHLSKGHMEEAEKTLQRIAEVNKTSVPLSLLNAKEENEEVGIEEARSPKLKLTDFCRSPKLIITFSVLLYNWFAVSLTYYGLSLHSGEVLGNPYLNVFLLCLVEIPAYTIDLLLLRVIGRRAVQRGSMLLGGTACLCTIIPVLIGDAKSLQIVVLLLELVGKLGAAMAFSTLYTYSSELLPTTIRSRGLGTCSMFARLAGIVAAYVAHLGSYMDSEFGVVMPPLVFGVASITAGFLTFLLPETRNREMMEHMHDLIDTMSTGKTTSSTESEPENVPLDEKLSKS